MAIYLKMDGVTGDVTEAGHADWVALESFQWGIGRGVNTPVGDAKSRDASLPSVSEITFTKMLDKASPDLVDALVSDTDGKPVTIDFVKSGKTNEIYLQYKLENVLVSGYSMSSGGDRPSESISINFTKFTGKYIGYDEANKTPDPVIKGYNIQTAKAF